MHYGTAKVRVLLVDPQTWQYEAANQRQSPHCEQSQEQDDRRSSNHQREIEERFKHGAFSFGRTLARSFHQLDPVGIAERLALPEISESPRYFAASPVAPVSLFKESAPHLCQAGNHS
jgi:hypothetical protein